ncbi:transposase InsO family protein [Catenulispora sp. MAP12-49]
MRQYWSGFGRESEPWRKPTPTRSSQAFATRAEARIRSATWISDSYNTRRRHSAAGGLAPAEFERINRARPAAMILQVA